MKIIEKSKTTEKRSCCLNINFLEKPTFVCVKRTTKPRSECVIHANKSESLIEYKLKSGIKGLPTLWDRKIQLYLLYKAQEAKKDKTLRYTDDNHPYLLLDSYYQVAKDLNLSPTSGWHKRRFESTLQKLMDTRMVFTKSFYVGKIKGVKKHKDAEFRVLEDFQLPINPKRGGCTKLKIVFNRIWYDANDSGVSKFVKSLNLQKLMELQSPIAFRLYEILCKSFRANNSFCIYPKTLVTKIGEGGTSFRIPSKAARSLIDAYKEMSLVMGDDFLVRMNFSGKYTDRITFTLLDEDHIPITKRKAPKGKTRCFFGD